MGTRRDRKRIQEDPNRMYLVKFEQYLAIQFPWLAGMKMNRLMSFVRSYAIDGTLAQEITQQGWKAAWDEAHQTKRLDFPQKVFDYGNQLLSK